MTGANLIPMYRRNARAKRRLIHRWIFFVATYLLVLSIAIPVARISHANDDSLNQQLAQKQDELDSIQTRLVGLKSEIEGNRIALRANRLVENQSDWSILMGVLAGEMGDRIVLRECSMKPQGVARDGSGPSHYQVDLRGYGQTQIEVSSYVLRLERTGLFSEVTLEESRREGFLEGDAIAFKLRCQLANRQETPS